jgi:5'-3' exonuclease
MKQQKIILMDTSALLYPIKHTLPNFSVDKENIDELINRFFKKVLSLNKKLGGDKVVFCYDTAFSYRKQLFDGYKVKRKTREKKEDEIEFDRELHKVMNRLEDVVLPALGFQCLSDRGCEADDVLAKIVIQDEYTFNDFVICTGDEDMFSCLKSPNVKVCLVNKLDKVVGQQWFIDKYNIHPKDWYKVKSLAGCSSDSVIGAKGVGEGSVCKWLNGELKESSVYYKRIMAFPKEKRDLNVKLVKIPIKATKEVVLDLSDKKLSMEDFTKFAMEMGFESFLNEQFEDWQFFLDGKTEITHSLKNRAKERRKK